MCSKQIAEKSLKNKFNIKHIKNEISSPDVVSRARQHMSCYLTDMTQTD